MNEKFELYCEVLEGQAARADGAEDGVLSKDMG